MKTFKIHPGTTNGKMYVRVSQSVEDEETGIITNKAGFIEVNPEKAQSLLEKLESEAITTEFGAYNPQNGLYAVLTAKAPVLVVADAE